MTLPLADVLSTLSTTAVGIVAAVIGLIVGFGYQFWSVRRAELAEAVRAAATLSEALHALDAPNGNEDSAGCPHLEESWQQQCRFLAIYIYPASYRELGEKVTRIASGSPQQGECKEVVTKIDALSNLLWREHNSFILYPLFFDNGKRAVVRRVQRILDPSEKAPKPKRGGLKPKWRRLT